MPAALAVDWSAVQATYAATGGNAEVTAKAHEIEAAAVRQRARRYGWKAQTAQVMAKAGLVPIKPVSANVTPCHEAVTKGVTDIKSKLGAKASLAAAKCVAKGFAATAKMTGEAIVSRASDLKSLAGVGQAIALPGFAQASSGPSLGISLSIQPSAGQVVDVEATVSPTE